MIYKHIILGTMLATSLVGCASVMHGANENFVVTSRPNHAVLTVDGVIVGKTPKKINLSRKKEHVLKVTLSGYEPSTIRFKKTVSKASFGNFLFGGVIGVVIDAKSGAMYKLTPKQVGKYASKSGLRYKVKSHTLMVFLAKGASKHWQKIGQLKRKIG